MEETSLVIQEIRDRVDPNLELPSASQIRQSGPFESLERFYNSAFNSFRELLLLTSINPLSRVLDYGCGLGRLAIPMSGFLDKERGYYYGLDVNKTCIKRNKQAFKKYSNFTFRHVNIYNKMYNRRGKRFDSLNDMDLGRSFDLACLFSVFTHILPSDCPLLLNFLYSNLVPQGELFASFFLLNEETLDAIERGMTHRKFTHTYDIARIDNIKVPEGAVAYFEQDVIAMLTAAGFSGIRVHHGNWRGRKTSCYWQDIIVANADEPR